MSVILLTLAISLCLVFTFVIFFLREHGRQRFSSAESDALLPLADEIPQLANAPRTSVPAKPVKEESHHHEHADGSSCGCQRGVLASKADFYYLGQGLQGLRSMFEVNDVRRRTQRGLLVFMIAYNLTAVGLAVSGLMHPLLAAVLMPLSSIATLAIVGLGMRRAWPD